LVMLPTGPGGGPIFLQPPAASRYSPRRGLTTARRGRNMVTLPGLALALGGCLTPWPSGADGRAGTSENARWPPSGAVGRRPAAPGDTAMETTRAQEAEHDAALVQRCLGGDAEAFHRLTARYYRPVSAFVLKRVGRPDVVEDLAQEAFLEAF